MGRGGAAALPRCPISTAPSQIWTSTRPPRRTMEPNMTTKQSWTRFGKLGAAVFACAALLVATQSTGASAQNDDAPNGIAARLATQSFQHMSDEIADAVKGQPAVWPNPNSPNGSMHFMFAPVFDSITPTEAVTRTPSVSLSGEKGTAIAKTATIRVYWDHWKKTDAGWRKTTSTWYRLD